jgi:segregation and condensation protein B
MDESTDTYAHNDEASDVDVSELSPAEPDGDGEFRSVRKEHLVGVLESLIFVSDKPLTIAALSKLSQAPSADVRDGVAQISEHYRGRGIELVEVANGYQFRSALANAPFVRDLVGGKPTKLSRAQIETLAIVAYRQPVTRPEVDEIRGVDCGAALKVLLERELIKVIGRKEEPGRPLLYGTTTAFLELFSLKSLRDLPTLKEFTDLTPESRVLFERNMGAPLNEADEDSANVESESDGEGKVEGVDEVEGELTETGSHAPEEPASDEMDTSP